MCHYQKLQTYSFYLVSKFCSVFVIKGVVTCRYTINVVHNCTWCRIHKTLYCMNLVACSPVTVSSFFKRWNVMDHGDGSCDEIGIYSDRYLYCICYCVYVCYTSCYQLYTEGLFTLHVLLHATTYMYTSRVSFRIV